MSQTLNLKIYKNNQFLEAKTIAQDVIKIGKLKSSHLCLEDDTVARMHAVIEVSGSDVRVIDLGSATRNPAQRTKNRHHETPFDR